MRSVPREATHREFTPIGHVVLSVRTADEYAKLGLPSEGVVWIQLLYMSYALHRSGFGAATVDQVEGLATREPWNATMIVLDAIAPECQMNDQALKRVYEDRGIPVPRVGVLSFRRRECR
jgi:hypothetical protein